MPTTNNTEAVEPVEFNLNSLIDEVTESEETPVEVETVSGEASESKSKSGE